MVTRGMSEGDNPESESKLGKAWSLDYGRGYEEGYQRAVSDLLSSLLRVCEEYAGHDAPTADELWKVLAPFEQHLERHLSRMSPENDGFVADGLGI
jgi:hypothetical protein